MALIINYKETRMIHLKEKRIWLFVGLDRAFPVTCNKTNRNSEFLYTRNFRSEGRPSYLGPILECVYHHTTLGLILEGTHHASFV